MNATQEGICSFVVSSGNAAILLEASKEVLNEVACFVQVLVVRAFFFAMPTTWNDDLFALLQERVNDPLLGVIALVSNDNCSIG